MKARQLIREGERQLEGDPSPRSSCEWILSELLGMCRTALYLDETVLPGEICDRFSQMVKDLQRGEPLQYLLGRAFFMGDSFEVTPNCFIPRPETEILVEASLDYLKEAAIRSPKPSLFIDVGTGSGCIAISLTKRIPSSKMLAIDLAEGALRVACRNSIFHGVSDRISWILGDGLTPLGRKAVQADAILSNPPYIPREALDFLPHNVRREPKVSLDGGTSGLSFYRRMAEEAPPFLKEGGLLFLEIGENQASPVADIFTEKSFFHVVEVRKDLCGVPRVVVFRKDRHG